MLRMVEGRFLSACHPTINLVNIGFDYFVIRFGCPEDYDYVLTQGPWLIVARFGHTESTRHIEHKQIHVLISKYNPHPQKNYFYIH